MSLDHDWLKGVPMELRPRYYPKPPLRFKDIDIYIPLDAIENDYDFTEERRVLAETKMWEEYKENERLAEEERQRQLAEEAERLRLEAEERLKQEEEERQLQIQLIKQKEEEDAAVAVENDDDGQLPPPTYQEAAAAAENTDDQENFPNSDRLPSSDNPSTEVLPCSSSSHQLQHQEAGAPVAPSESETATAAAVVTPPHNGYHYSDIQLPMYHQHHHHQPIQSYYNYYAPLPQQQIQATTSVPPQQQPPMQYHLASANSQNVGSSGGSILQPQPPPPVISSGGGEASGAGTGTNSPSGSEKSSSTTSQHNHQPSKKVDLSDFEADTANPFDNVELKSINDMEVLASVLKNNMNMNTSTNTNTSLPHHHHHHPNSSQPSSSSATDAPTSHQHPPPYVNGVSPGYERGPPPTYYHQPTPIFPPVSQQQQCPYTTWNQNGYYPLPTSSASSPAVPVTTAAGSGPVHQNQNRPVSSGSHVPSPTQGMEQIPTQQPGGVGPPGGVNSFTKLHFPYLTSMAATQSRRDRDTSLSGYYRGYTPSTEDITSQNPFLSNYVSAPAPPQLSHSPMQHHQYWPAHMTATHQQQQPQNLYPMNHNTTTSAPPPPLDPQQNQSQHALR